MKTNETRYLLHACVDPELKTAMTRLATVQGVSLSALIRRLCADELRRCVEARHPRTIMTRDETRYAHAFVAEVVRRRRAEAEKSQAETWGSRSIGSRL